MKIDDAELAALHCDRVRALVVRAAEAEKRAAAAWARYVGTQTSIGACVMDVEAEAACASAAWHAAARELAALVVRFTDAGRAADALLRRAQEMAGKEPEA